MQFSNVPNERGSAMTFEPSIFATADYCSFSFTAVADGVVETRDLITVGIGFADGSIAIHQLTFQAAEALASKIESAIMDRVASKAVQS